MTDSPLAVDENLSYCQLRQRLAEDLAAAARLYSECAANLAANFSAREYPALCSKLEEARRRSESAILAYKEHIDSHRCLRTAHQRTKATIA